MTPFSMPALSFNGAGGRLHFDQPIENPELRRRWEWLFSILTDHAQPESVLSLDEAIKHAAPYYDDDYQEPIAIPYVVTILSDQVPFDNPGYTKFARFLIQK